MSYLKKNCALALVILLAHFLRSYFFSDFLTESKVFCCGSSPSTPVTISTTSDEFKRFEFLSSRRLLNISLLQEEVVCENPTGQNLEVPVFCAAINRGCLNFANFTSEAMREYFIDMSEGSSEDTMQNLAWSATRKKIEYLAFSLGLLKCPIILSVDDGGFLAASLFDTYNALPQSFVKFSDVVSGVTHQNFVISEILKTPHVHGMAVTAGAVILTFTAESLQLISNHHHLGEPVLELVNNSY